MKRIGKTEEMEKRRRGAAEGGRDSGLRGEEGRWKIKKEEDEKKNVKEEKRRCWMRRMEEAEEEEDEKGSRRG